MCHLIENVNIYISNSKMNKVKKNEIKKIKLL